MQVTQSAWLSVGRRIVLENATCDQSKVINCHTQ